MKHLPKIKLPYLTLILSLIVGFSVWFHYANLTIQGDAKYYFRLAKILKEDFPAIFTSKDIGVAESLNGIFQGIFMKFPGNDIFNVYVFQIIIYAFTAFIIFKLSSYYLNHNIGALIAAGFFIFNHKYLTVAYSFKPAIWTTFLLSLIVYMAFKIYKKPDINKNWIFCALLIGFMLLLDMRYMPHLGVLTLMLAFNNKSFEIFFKKLPLIIGIILIVITPWLIRQYLVFDGFIFISELKTIMIHKAFKTDRYKKLIQYTKEFEEFADLPQQELIAIGKKKNLSLSEVIFIVDAVKEEKSKINIYGNKQHQELINQGILTAQQVREMVAKEENKSNIRKNFEYALYMWKPFQFSYTYLPLTVQKNIVGPWSFLSNINRIITIGLLIPFFLIGMIRIVYNKDIFGVALILILIIHTAIHVLTYVQPRYVLPVLPYYTIISISGMLIIAKYLKNRIRTHK